MQKVFRQSVCPKCGSNKVWCGTQSHDDNNEFHTKKWWEENPDIEPSDIQIMVAISDPTDYLCLKCDYEFSYEECERAEEIWKKNIKGEIYETT